MDDFDREIRNSFHARQLPGAPAGLLQTLEALPARQTRPGLGGFRLVLGLAATLAVLVVAAVVVSVGTHALPPVGSPPPSLPAVIGPSVEPSEEPSVAPSELCGWMTLAVVWPCPTTARPSVPTPTPQLTPPPPTPTPAANDGPAGMIDLLHGWAVGDQRLLLTADGGATWRDVTPPAPTHGGSPANLLNVQFLDPDHGWAAFAEPFNLATDPSFGRIDVWRTPNGGGTWAKSELPKAKINNDGDTLPPFSFDFLDLTHGYAFLTGPYTHRAGDSDLYWTADGGKTWSADRPTGSGYFGVEGSSIAFATADDGVIVGNPGGSGISVTHDAGKTWANATLSAPSSYSGDLRVFSQPVFSDARTGFVAVRFQGNTGSQTNIYRTTNAGSSWPFLASVPGSGALTVTIVDDHHWIATDGGHAVHTQNGGASWTQLVTQPPLNGLQAVQFVDLKHGWAQWTDKLGNSHISATTDEGASWHRLAP